MINKYQIMQLKHARTCVHKTKANKQYRNDQIATRKALVTHKISSGLRNDPCHIARYVQACQASASEAYLLHVTLQPPLALTGTPSSPARNFCAF